MGALSISFSKPPTNVADAYAADGAHDTYLMVKPPQTLTKAEEEDLISAVRDTTRAVGALSCERGVSLTRSALTRYQSALSEVVRPHKRSTSTSSDSGRTSREVDEKDARLLHCTRCECALSML